MKKIRYIILSVLIIALFPIKSVKGEDELFAGQEWYDLVEVVEVNRESPHSYFIPYQSEELALDNEKSIFTKNIYKSDYIQNLNGEWMFYFVDSPYKQLSWNDEENWNVENWDTITVPSNVQLQFDSEGFKYDKPIYINMLYPWVNYEQIKLSEYPKAPLINNSVSHYKKEFIIEKEWNNRQVFINFDGIGSAFYLFINGKKVGYSEDTYTTHQFNITQYLNKDENGNISNQTNTIAIQLYRFSTGSYIENQDMIRLNGIFRDVFLISKDNVEIRDIFVNTHTEENTVLDLEVSVRNLLNVDNTSYIVEADLFDENNNKVWNQSLVIDYTLEQSINDISLLSKDVGVINKASKNIDNPIFWSDENPYLYRLLVKLKDINGNVVEITCIRFGIRDVEINVLENGKQQITLNGVPLLIKGVNRHEIDSIKGSALTKEDIINDLMLIKQNNINAIRTSHYPNNVITYQVADEIGLLIMDEANIESHYGAIADNIPSVYPAWKYSVLDRIKNMIERDKNYTSIIMWSLGNESTYNEYPMDENYSMFLATSLILNRDPSRLRAYERDNRYTDTREGSMVDIFSSQYMSVEAVKSHLNGDNKLPYIQSEYVHSMGNALGNLKEYWDLFRDSKNGQGGFIWDYKDQALLIPTNFNKTSLEKNTYGIEESFYAYGGDFGERISDLEFSGNGIVFANGNISPKMYEVKKVYQSINFKDLDLLNGKFNVDNEYSFTNLNEFTTSYKIINDNKVIKEGTLNLPCNAKSNLDFEVPLDYNLINNGLYSSIIFEVKLKKDTNYNLFKDDIIAYEQFELYKGQQIKTDNLTSFNNIVDEKDYLNVSGTSTFGNYDILFNKTTGLFDYKLNDEYIFKQGPVLNYTRSPISNDTQYTFNENKASKYAIELENTQEAYDISNINIKQNDNNIEINILGKLKISNEIIKIKYVIYGDGTISVNNEFQPTSKLSGIIPKVGMEFSLDNKFNAVTYYGKGPFENYVDRNSAAIKNIYSDTVENMFTGLYLKPQENGNRTLVDFIKMQSKDNYGLLITGNNLQFSALPYNHKQLNNAKHTYELLNSDYTYLNINGEVRGLGNAICGDLPLSQYTIIPDKTISYSYKIIPFSNDISLDDIIKFVLHEYY